jgi:hypothetical protein
MVASEDAHQETGYALGIGVPVPYDEKTGYNQTNCRVAISTRMKLPDPIGSAIIPSPPIGGEGGFKASLWYEAPGEVRMSMWKQAFFWRIVALSLVGLILPMAGPLNAYAGSTGSGGLLIYATGRSLYTQGDIVTITVTNTSDAPVAIVDRVHIDAGFATIERQAENGQRQVIELYTAANVTVFRALGPGERHQYLWQTVGYNRADTIAPPGTYRVSFGRPMCSNPFEIKAK